MPQKLEEEEEEEEEERERRKLMEYVRECPRNCNIGQIQRETRAANAVRKALKFTKFHDIVKGSDSSRTEWNFRQTTPENHTTS